MWEIFTHPDEQHSVGSIEIDHARGLVRKTFALSGVARNKPWLSDANAEDMRKFFSNDVKWLGILAEAGADFVPKLIDVDETKHSYIIPYLGPDLLISHVIPRVTYDLQGVGFKQQVLSHFQLYQRLGMYKYNHAAINHCLVGSKVMVIDFKWASLRGGPRHRSLADDTHAERYAIENWMVKLDPTLPELLLTMI